MWKFAKKRNDIITCDSNWHANISECVYWLDTHSIKVWWRYSTSDMNGSYLYLKILKKKKHNKIYGRLIKIVRTQLYWIFKTTKNNLYPPHVLLLTKNQNRGDKLHCSIHIRRTWKISGCNWCFFTFTTYLPTVLQPCIESRQQRRFSDKFVT